jgi:hypothetical protein
MSSQLIWNKTKNDLEFEWLLCVTTALMASRRLLAPEVEMALRSQDFPMTKTEDCFDLPVLTPITPS